MAAVALASALALPASAAPLTLGELDRRALAGEAGVEALEARARAEDERAIADAQLPDPTLSVGALNFPVDTFAFDQERMTQLRLGVRQQFPAPGTLAARRAVGDAKAGAQRAAADLRRREVLRAAREAWLTLLWRLEERALMEAERPRLVVIERSVLAGYGQGAGTQQDVFRARLEIDALDERLLQNAEAIDLARAGLARWIGAEAALVDPVPPAAGSILAAMREEPDAGHDSAPGAESDPDPGPDPAALEALRGHPMLAVRGARIEEAEARIELAEADYGPDWGVEVGYGVRDELSPTGDTPDFLSAVVTVELPLFTGQRQDRRLAAARADRQAAGAERTDALRELELQYRSMLARLERLASRRALQMETIAPRSERTARAALDAYRANAGDFPEVMRAVLAELEVHLTVARLDHELRRVFADLDYLVGAAPAATGVGTEQR